MSVSSPHQTLRRGFTLVEMLVVIAIIGVLAGLITAVAIRARKTANEATITMDFSQLDQALKAYKAKYGEYPPDGTDTRSTLVPGIPDAFYRHFQRVFPRANLVNELTLLNQNNKFPCDASNYAAFFQNYTPATALVFWLGGMQEDNYSTVNTKNPKSRFVGFSANPLRPLSDGSSSRLPMWYEFNTDKIGDPTGATVSSTLFRTYQGNVNVPLPYVYFRAELNQKYPYLTPTNVVKTIGTTGPRPYYDSVSQSWINHNSYQLIFCGFDSTFGRGNWYPIGRWPPNPKPLPMPLNWQNVYFQYDGANHDDITNFAGGVIGNKIP